MAEYFAMALSQKMSCAPGPKCVAESTTEKWDAPGMSCKRRLMEWAVCEVKWTTAHLLYVVQCEARCQEYLQENRQKASKTIVRTNERRSNIARTAGGE